MLNSSSSNSVRLLIRKVELRALAPPDAHIGIYVAKEYVLAPFARQCSGGSKPLTETQSYHFGISFASVICTRYQRFFGGHVFFQAWQEHIEEQHGSINELLC